MLLLLAWLYVILLYFNQICWEMMSCIWLGDLDTDCSCFSIVEIFKQFIGSTVISVYNIPRLLGVNWFEDAVQQI